MTIDKITLILTFTFILEAGTLIYYHNRLVNDLNRIQSKISALNHSVKNLTVYVEAYSKAYYGPIKHLNESVKAGMVIADFYYLPVDNDSVQTLIRICIDKGFQVNEYPLVNQKNMMALYNSFRIYDLNFPYEAYSWVILRNREEMFIYRVDMIDEGVIDACGKILNG